MSTNSDTNPADLNIESVDINIASGIDLSAQQKVLVGSILDLFKGKPTLRKLQLWTDDATFQDPLTNSQGRKQYSAQWYGLVAAFSTIEQLHHSVTKSGNPIELDLKSKYVVKGLGKEQIISSVVRIHTTDDCSKITGVQDRWNGSIPTGAIAMVFRNLNAVVVPAFVSVPKSDAEEVKKENQ